MAGGYLERDDGTLYYSTKTSGKSKEHASKAGYDLLETMTRPVVGKMHFSDRLAKAIDLKTKLKFSYKEDKYGDDKLSIHDENDNFVITYNESGFVNTNLNFKELFDKLSLGELGLNLKTIKNPDPVDKYILGVNLYEIVIEQL